MHNLRDAAPLAVGFCCNRVLPSQATDLVLETEVPRVTDWIVVVMMVWNYGWDSLEMLNSHVDSLDWNVAWGLKLRLTEPWLSSAVGCGDWRERCIKKSKSRRFMVFLGFESFDCLEKNDN